MIVLLDTSSPLCKLTLVEGSTKNTYEWQADRMLAHGLLAFLRDTLAAQGRTFKDIAGIGVMKGPGSFTGLRIGLTVVNTIASDQDIPIVGVEYFDGWQNQALEWLSSGKNDQLVMPYYGAEARITKPRK